MPKHPLLPRAVATLLAFVLLVGATGVSDATGAPGATAADLVIRSTDALAGDGTVIAIIDSGFDPSHPAFTLPEGARPTLVGEAWDTRVAATAAGMALAVPGGEDIADLRYSEKIPFTYDYVNDTADVTRGVTSHGTHVAALSAAGGTAEDTYPGVAPAAQLLLMKVFDDTGLHCEEATLVRAVRDAIALGADVISMSLGSLAPSEEAVYMPYLAVALREAEEAGIVVVAAAGNDGETGIGGLVSDKMHTANPDTGLSSEPAVLESVLSVGASRNGVEYDFYLIADDTRIRYSLPAEVKETDPTPGEVLGGEAYPCVLVPGLGTAEDVAAVDVAGKIALIYRGEISFLEKIENAAAAGALAVIIINGAGEDAITMSADGASVPAVLVSYDDGAQIAQAQSVLFADGLGTFPATDAGMADFSSRGPTADMQLSVDITAVGAYVLSAAEDGYDVLSGTSMAAPQIAGLSASLLAARRDYFATLPAAERPAAVRALLMSAAVPLTDASSGLPLTPRAQGAGQLSQGANAAEMTVTLTGEAGQAAIELSDHLPKGGQVSFPVTVTNTGEEAVTLTLSAVMTTEGYETRDGQSYVTGLPEEIPGEIRFSADTLTVPSGASRTVTVTLIPDAHFLTARDAIFPNGFYLEGFLIASDAAGAHVASSPFFGFCGDWDQSPILDGGDWDGYVSYYGGQQLLIKNSDGTARDAGNDSALFAFSPNGDGVAESVAWRLYPLRHAAGCKVEILAEDGATVAEYAYTAAEKTYYQNGSLLYYELSLWDGTDTYNSHYFWPDGQYTARITVHSFTGAFQVVEIPLTVDTAAPKLAFTVEDGQLTATATDDGMLTSLKIYAPDPETAGEMLYETAVTRAQATLSLTADFPKGAEYVYIRAEDAAGNVTVHRVYAEVLTDTEKESGEEAAA